jgi:hypothetical protein
MGTRRARNFRACPRLKPLPIVWVAQRIPLRLQEGTGFAVTQICSVACRNFPATALLIEAAIAHAVEEVVDAFLGVPFVLSIFKMRSAK